MMGPRSTRRLAPGPSSVHEGAATGFRERASTSMSGESVALTYLHGHSPGGGDLGVLAVPRDMPASRAHSRVETFRSGRWSSVALDFQGVALTHLEGEDGPACWVLGRGGEVARISEQGVLREQLPGAGTDGVPRFGYVDALRVVGGELYACGYGRQVYVRRDGAWTCVSEAILTQEEGPGFLDVDGRSASALWAVGWLGELWHFDGEVWRQEESPTSAHLTALRVLPNGDAWACGFGGTVLHRRNGAWSVIDPGEFKGNWYGLERFGERLYLAGHGRLARVEDGRVVGVETGLGQRLSTHRLHASEGTLWSIAETQLLRFDGATWTALAHPNNA